MRKIEGKKDEKVWQSNKIEKKAKKTRKAQGNVKEKEVFA
jgi:hypothetical protein